MLSSGHHFAVEVGRWQGVPRQDRKCPLCHVMEDEIHALLECPKYMDLRSSECRTDSADQTQETVLEFVRKALKEGSEDMPQVANYFRQVLKRSYSEYSVLTKSRQRYSIVEINFAVAVP